MSRICYTYYRYGYSVVQVIMYSLLKMLDLAYKN